MRFCNDNGIPHSEFLRWDAVDRAKQIAYMMEEGTRCSLCGTADWEWEENKRAYLPIEHFCRGCYIEKSYSEDQELLPGTTVRLAKSSDALVGKLEEKRKRFSKDFSQGA